MKEETANISDRRLALIRQLIELAYTYCDKELFYKKFMEAVSINSLKDSRIVVVDDHDLGPTAGKRLTENEAVMYSLMRQGFTPREITVICREKSINTVYLKQHRLKKKLGGRVLPEIVSVMLVISVIFWIILKLLNFPGF